MGELDVKGWKWYGTKKLQVCPYMPGTPVFVDGMLSHVYYELKRLGRVEQSFCGDSMNHDRFVSFFDQLKTAQILCSVEQDGKLVPSGISWLNNPHGCDGARNLTCGFAFFKEGASKSLEARDLARLAVAYCFNDLRVDTIFGEQVADNIAARNFSVRVGFKEVAYIPDRYPIGGCLVDGRVMMVRKKDFWPGFIKWKEVQDQMV